MSWDLFLMKFPAAARVVEDVPEGWMPPVIGSRADVTARILEVAPDADFSDPTRGEIDGPGFSIGVGIGDDDAITCISLFVRGSNEAAASLITDLLDHLGVRAVETGNGGFFDRETARAGFHRSLAYRDYVMRRSSDAER